jgi:hypothetical protein
MTQRSGKHEDLYVSINRSFDRAHRQLKQFISQQRRDVKYHEETPFGIITKIFTLRYSDNIERMAIIGHKVWEETWIALFGLFSHIRTQYFDRSEIKAAWKWIQN